MKPVISENFADNGAHSHWSVIDSETGRILIEAIAESAKEQVIEADSSEVLTTQKHQLEYSIWSALVSWCPICKNHFYNDRNKEHTTIPTKEHYHIYEGE